MLKFYSKKAIANKCRWLLAKNLISCSCKGLSNPVWEKTEKTRVGYDCKENGLELNEYFVVPGDGSKCLFQELPKIDLSHKYYVGLMFKSFSINNSDCLIRCFNMNIVDIDLAYNTHGKWKLFSYIYSGNTNKVDKAILQINNDDKYISIANLVMIDLTQTFGIGKEPSKKWCDNNIKDLGKGTIFL